MKIGALPSSTLSSSVAVDVFTDCNRLILSSSIGQGNQEPTSHLAGQSEAPKSSPWQPVPLGGID